MRPPASRRLLDFVGVDERQKRTLSATVGGLIGSVVTGFALNALIDDPMVAWISVAVSFVVFEAVVIYMVNTRVAVGQKSVLRPGAPKPRWFLRLLHIAGRFFVFLGALLFVGHVLVRGSGRNSRVGRVRRVDPGR